MNINLKQWDYKYSDDLVEYFQDKEIYKFLSNDMPYPYKKSDAYDYINLMKDNPYAKAIVLNNKAIGSIAAEVNGDTAEIGYCLGKKYWSKGIMTEALNMFIKHNIKVNNITVKVHPKNIASIRVLEKNGFNLKESGEWNVFSYTR